MINAGTTPSREKRHDRQNDKARDHDKLTLRKINGFGGLPQKRKAAQRSARRLLRLRCLQPKVEQRLPYGFTSETPRVVECPRKYITHHLLFVGFTAVSVCLEAAGR